MSNSRLRRFCFTIQPLEADEVLDSTIFEATWVRRWIYSIEKGKENGVLHAQGYVEMNTRMYFSQVKQWFKDHGWASVHLEAAKGTCKQCYDYCTKLETHVDGPYCGGRNTNDRQMLAWLEWSSHEDWIPDNIYDFCSNL